MPDSQGEPMADEDKTPDAIKRHKVQNVLNPPGPGGSAIRQASAHEVVGQDHQRQGTSGFERYLKSEKSKLASTKDIDGEPPRGRLSQEMSKQAPNEPDRADKHVRAEKAQLVSGKDMDERTRGRLTAEMNKHGQDKER